MELKYDKIEGAGDEFYHEEKNRDYATVPGGKAGMGSKMLESGHMDVINMEVAAVGTEVFGGPAVAANLHIDACGKAGEGGEGSQGTHRKCGGQGHPAPKCPTPRDSAKNHVCNEWGTAAETMEAASPKKGHQKGSFGKGSFGKRRRGEGKGMQVSSWTGACRGAQMLDPYAPRAARRRRSNQHSEHLQARNALPRSRLVCRVCKRNFGHTEVCFPKSGSTSFSQVIARKKKVKKVMLGHAIREQRHVVGKNS